MTLNGVMTADARYLRGSWASSKQEAHHEMRQRTWTFSTMTYIYISRLRSVCFSVFFFMFICYHLWWIKMY